MIRLPKKLRSFRFTKLVPFDLNDAQLDTLLPVLFQRVVLGNRELTSTANDPTDIRGPVEKLTNYSERISGFSTAQNIELLDRIIRTSVVSIGYKGVGRKKSDQQISGLVPLTIATFKVGFPKERTRMRGIDQFVYDLLLERFRGNHDELFQDFMDTFGQGVAVDGFPTPRVERLPGPQASQDVLTELSIAYIDGFNAIKPKTKVSTRTFAQPLPEFQRRFGEDIHRSLKTYRSRVPVTLLTEQLITLIAFEITIMSIKMFFSVPALVENCHIDDSQLETNAPQAYIDLTGDPRHYSRLMAQRCVQRDRAQVDTFIESVLFLKYLDREVTQLRSDSDFRSDVERLIGTTDAPMATLDYMRGLLTALDADDLGPELRRAARATVKEIRTENSDTTHDGDDIDEEATSSSQEFEDVIASRDKPIDQVRAFLEESQISKIRQNAVRWLSDVGGVGKAYGLIQGASDRRSWAYAPTNDLLSVLVQLCATDYKGWHPSRNATPQPIPLPHFLEWLEDRFGIIVDRPPANFGFDSPEHMAAARVNLGALLRRLQQMGIFEDQSDDFSVQVLTPPFLQPVERREPADETAAGSAT